MFLLLSLGNGWADCVEIWYALGAPSVTAYAVLTGGVSLHVRTCTPRFCISGTARPIVFKFGVWVGGHYRSAFHKSCMVCICTCARAHPLSHKCSSCCHSVTVGPIALKFGMHLETHQLQLMQYSRVGYRCTCARAHRAPVSQERLGRLCSNLVCRLVVITEVLSTSHGWRASARAHVLTPFP